MTELSTSLSEPQIQDFSSNRLDDPQDTTQGQPAKAPEPKESRLDAIKRAAQDVGVKDKEEAKPDDVKADEKPAKTEAEPAKEEAEPEPKAAAETVKAEEKPRRQPIEAPAKFLPRAKELWQNVPHEVRSEMQRVMAENETEATQARESVKEYESVRPYAELAKRNGTDLATALQRYNDLENTLRHDPATGFRNLTQQMGMGPVQAIGHILSAYNVRPEQLAMHIAQNPNEYTGLAQPQRQQAQPQPNNEVEGLKQQLAQLQQMMQHQQLASSVIEPFAKENPRYYELEDTIAQFLTSDIIPKALSPHDRLAAAYDMAVRISPAKKSAIAPVDDEDEGEADSRAGKDFGGTKSVRGAPSTGVDTTNRRKSKLSRGDALNQAMADLGLAH